MAGVPAFLKGRDFTRISDWSGDELRTALELADQLKRLQAKRVRHELLPGRSLGLMFNLASTRTRISFEVGVTQLGGMGISLNVADMHLARGETMRDTAHVVSRYVDAVVIRTASQAQVDELATHADVPVINGLTDVAHPCQALTDVMTIREHVGRLEGVRLGYLGDGNNVCASLMIAAAELGMEFAGAFPEGYEPPAHVVEQAREAAAGSGGCIELLHDPDQAAAGADVLYTDVWVSMGQEAERERRLAAFEPYRIDERLIARGAPQAFVMNCLPAHYGEEISEQVLYGPRSIVWDQAENRLHAQKALMALVMQ
ncbi:MAG: ornithine carbamoyltransferase [Gaiellaceae bacterium]